MNLVTLEERALLNENPIEEAHAYATWLGSFDTRIRQCQIQSFTRLLAEAYRLSAARIAEDLSMRGTEALPALGRLSRALISYVEISFAWRPWYLWAQRSLKSPDLTASDRAMLVYGLGRFEGEMGHFSESISLHRTGLEASTKNHVLEMALNYRGLGIVYQLGTEWLLANKSLMKAVKLLESIHEPYYLALTMANVAGYHYRRKDYPAAIEWYHRNLAVYQEASDDFLIDNTWYSLGWVYYEQKQFVSARDAFNLCLTLSQPRPERRHEVGLGYYGLGATLYRMGSYEDAIDALEKAYTIFQHELNNVMAGLVLQLIADAYRKSSRFELAEAALRDALRLHEKTEYVAQLSLIHLKIGKLRLLQGQLQQASLEFQEASEIAKKVKRDDLKLIANIGWLEANLLLSGPNKPMVAMIRRCLETAVRLQDNDAVERLSRLLPKTEE